MQVLKEDIRDRILAISLEHFRENYTDRSTEVVKAWFASMQQKHPEINTEGNHPNMRYRQRTYEHSTVLERLARRKSSRRFPSFLFIVR